MGVLLVKREKQEFNFISNEKQPSGNRLAISKTVNYL